MAASRRLSQPIKSLAAEGLLRMHQKLAGCMHFLRHTATTYRPLAAIRDGHNTVFILQLSQPLRHRLTTCEVVPGWASSVKQLVFYTGDHQSSFEAQTAETRAVEKNVTLQEEKERSKGKSSKPANSHEQPTSSLRGPSNAHRAMPTSEPFHLSRPMTKSSPLIRSDTRTPVPEPAAAA